jgi:hypothetical protein
MAVFVYFYESRIRFLLRQRRLLIMSCSFIRDCRIKLCDLFFLAACVGLMLFRWFTKDTKTKL